MVYIYVLQLSDGKYYVGKTTNPSFRLENHFNKNGSQWTRKYQPIDVIELIPDCNDEEEDIYTIRYMKKYGIDNVRGGSFVQLELSKGNQETLQQMINGQSDRCFKCGNIGHFANECSNNDTEEIEVWECEFCEKEFDTEHEAMLPEKKCSQKRKVEKSFITTNKSEYFDNSDSSDDEKYSQKRKMEKCFRCGRTGHRVADCYASTIINKSKDEKKCLQKKKVNKSEDEKCFRCGRTGHRVADCYASTISKSKKDKY